MLQKFTCFFLILSAFSFSLACADDCCQSLEMSAGWRRDDLDWKTNKLRGKGIRGYVNSKIHFKDIDFYTLSAKAKWVGTNYYIRASAEYGLSTKGRADEEFYLKSREVVYPLSISTSDSVKRNSEVYDFDLAAGYPFTFCDCSLSITPLIGFSYHRQHFRVKEKSPHSGGCCYDETSSFKGSSFCVKSSNPFVYDDISSNPFASSSYSDQIASELGLFNWHRTDSYRFTWYGFYLGMDIAYALDSCWTIFTELEGHFLNRCHRKRKSWTGVSYVDSYHHQGWAYGFNGVFGLTYAFSTSWYSILSVDYDWWKSDNKHDCLKWEKAGAKIGLGYMF